MEALHQQGDYKKHLYMAYKIMERYNIPRDIHDPSEFVHQAYIDLGVFFKSSKRLTFQLRNIIQRTKSKVVERSIFKHHEKICVFCKESKMSVHFRKRYKHGGLDEIIWGFEPTCIECENIKTLAHYHSNKTDPEYYAKMKERNKKSRENCKELRNINTKNWREQNTEHCKNYTKQYNEKNRDLIIEKRKADAESLSDNYISGLLLCGKNKLSRKEITSEIISFKRDEIIALRYKEKQEAEWKEKGLSSRSIKVKLMNKHKIKFSEVSPAMIENYRHEALGIPLKYPNRHL